MVHDPAASRTRSDRPNGVATRSYLTTVLETYADLRWYKLGDGRMWLVSARRFYDCIEQLAKQRITVYASAEDVASFPPPIRSWTTRAGNAIQRSEAS